jgi:hypothetical protein
MPQVSTFDLGVKELIDDGRPSMDQDPFHPVLSPHELDFDFSNVTRMRPKKHRREASAASLLKRKPISVGPPIPWEPAPAIPPWSAPGSDTARDTPDITVDTMDVTPESVKVRRMRFRLDLDADASPPRFAGLSASTSLHGSRRRERSASTSEVIDDSPSKGRSQNSRESDYQARY